MGGGNHMSDTIKTLESEQSGQMPSSGLSIEATSNEGQKIWGRNAYIDGKHESDINHINGQLTVIQVDIAGIKSDITGLKSDVAGLKTDMTKLESELNSKMDKLDNRLNSKMDKLESGLNSKMDKLESGLKLSMAGLENSLNASMASLLRQFEVSLAKMDAGRVFHYSLSISIIVALLFFGISTWIK
jgi:chromosome segregation ATPase